MCGVGGNLGEPALDLLSASESDAKKDRSLTCGTVRATSSSPRIVDLKDAVG